MTTPQEIEQRVLKAMVEVYRPDMVCLPDESALAAIVRLSSVQVGHVKSILEQFGVKGTFGNGLVMTRLILERIEAHVVQPLAQPPAAVGNQHWNVSMGPNSQMQAGHQVNGSQNMTTYQQVLETLRHQIEASPMPEEQKKSALQKLGEFMAIPGVVELISLGANVLPHL